MWSILLRDAVKFAPCCQIWNIGRLLYRFDSLVQTKKSINGVYKTNIDYSFIRGLVENYCTLGKIQSSPPIHLSPTGLCE